MSKRSKRLNAFPEIPDDVRNWLRKIFSECNDAVSSQVSRIPTIQETYLDMTFVSQVSKYAAPFKMASNWVVQVETHYLGGMRHFMERWEIADIGILMLFRKRGKIIRAKTVLLQSKRLYPDEQEWDEATMVDYGVGFARLAKSDHEAAKLLESRAFNFGAESRYKALVVEDEQYIAIQNYEATNSTPVFYLLYNPMALPWTRVLPADSDLPVGLRTEVGCRVVASRALRQSLRDKPALYKPTYKDILLSKKSELVGYRLEEFIVDRVLACHDGHAADNFDDNGIRGVFYRRSGPIAAALAITIDAP